jgi:hypothetical protein
MNIHSIYGKMATRDLRLTEPGNFDKTPNSTDGFS